MEFILADELKVNSFPSVSTDLSSVGSSSQNVMDTIRSRGFEFDIDCPI